MTAMDYACCALDFDHDGPCRWICSTCNGSGRCDFCETDCHCDDVVQCEWCDGNHACPECEYGWQPESIS